MRVPFALLVGLLGCANVDVGPPAPHVIPPTLDLGSEGLYTIGDQAPFDRLYRMGTPADTFAPHGVLDTRGPIYMAHPGRADSVMSIQTSVTKSGDLRCISVEFGPRLGYLNMRDHYKSLYGPPINEWNDQFGWFALWGDAYLALGVAAGPLAHDSGGVYVFLGERDPDQDLHSRSYHGRC